MSADPGDPASDTQPDAVASESRPPPATLAETNARQTPNATSGARAPSTRCSAPPEYDAVAIGELIDDPEAHQGAPVQTVAPADFVLGYQLQCQALECKEVPVLQMQLLGPADELDLQGGMELFPGNGTSTARVWGTLEADGYRPVLVVDGSCQGGVVPCSLADQACPSTMSCVLDDCDWNGGNCGINPPGRCEFP